MTPAPRTYWGISIGLGDIALVVIAVFVILAYFNGWGN
jgi:hypothetical protein